MSTHQCSMSLVCKSITCTHAAPHSPNHPNNCDTHAPCCSWPGKPGFQPMVKCIPVDQVKPIGDCPDCGLKEGEGHHYSDCIHAIKQQRDQLKATIEAMRMQLMTVNDIAGEAMGSKSYDWHVRATAATNTTYDLLRKTPEQHFAEHDAQVIEQFKNELVRSVSVVFRPHIEGVCAVVQNQLRQKPQEFL